MKLAIMQPYLFPWIGYFQLMNSVEKFVIYDDVSSSDRRWINRNKVLVNNQEHVFTIPLQQAGHRTLIKDLKLTAGGKWKTKLLKTFEQSYAKSPHFETVFPLILKVIQLESEYIKDWHLKSFELINNYLGIKTVLVESSSAYDNQELMGQDRVLDICIKDNVSHYINTIAGKNLYDENSFSEHKIKLSFLETETVKYKQYCNRFFPFLSIIDVMMFNEVGTVQKFLNHCRLATFVRGS